MSAPLDAAVTDHVNLIADRIYDFGKLIERRSAPIELSASVVGHHNRVSANIDCSLGIFHRHDALQAKGLAPPPPDFRGSVPVHGLIQHR